MRQLCTDEEPDDKSCTTQHFPIGPPNSEWFPEQIMAYIQVQYQVILDNECMLAVNYWRLGKATEALRKTFSHGQWEQFLKTAKLHKSKVSAPGDRAAFEKEDDLVGLTIQEAYNHRSRTQQASAEPPAGESRADSVRFAGFLDHVSRLADPFIDDAAFANASQAAALLPALEQVLAKFERIHELLVGQTSKG